ncbi:Metal chaperone, involved in Zn homeostasis [hydrothermal vent metagenome]|uniref:Metal chaperone, involved in Zn homeostasis n=1 Tax=hydrothermal vent metagenome TaxID=652676 RepID=A0A3B0WM65_9ZZZZ
MPSKICNVPTNIISGFLGVGKTTAILNLFSKKSDTTKWAVLVNEFGKVGIDGQVYQSNGIAVKEIPGGCMCCAQGLPLQVAVNRLLRETKPDRLIIESSGVGHPAGVLKTLSSKDFNNVLKLKAGICLLDPEHLINKNYQENDLFNEQLQFADILVANKTDLASAEALQAFQQLASTFKPEKTHIASTTNGQLNTDWLDYKHQPHKQKFSFKALSGTISEASSGTFSETPSKNWQTHTFHYSENTRFDIEALKHWLSTVNILRLKGIVQTAEGYYLLNYSTRQVDVTQLKKNIKQPLNSYIEAIDLDLNIGSLESGIASCITRQP